MAKLNISQITDTITEKNLLELINKTTQKVGLGNITAIQMTSAQQNYISGYAKYRTKSVAIQVSGTNYVADIDTLPTPTYASINVEIV